MVLLYTLFSALAVVLTATVIVARKEWLAGKSFDVEISVQQPERVVGEREERTTQPEMPAAKADVSNMMDEEMFLITLRGLVSELLRTGKLLQSHLLESAKNPQGLPLVDTKEEYRIMCCGQGLDEALGYYRNDLPRALQITVRHLYDMVTLALVINTRVRKGMDNQLCHHLAEELKARDTFPWELTVPKPVPSLHLLDQISNFCESLKNAKDWIEQGDTDVETVFRTLADGRTYLGEIERSLGINV